MRPSSLSAKATALAFAVVFSLEARAFADPATAAGNKAATDLAARSPLVQSARLFLGASAVRLVDPKLRQETIDAMFNAETCIRHRVGVDAAKKAALLARLAAEGLLDTGDDAFPGGLRAGVFPPVRDDGHACPHLPQPFFAAPGSGTGGHHAFPGGLMVHEAFNEMNSVNLASAYRAVYGATNGEGLPEVHLDAAPSAPFFIDQDAIVAAPMWHDWAKAIVFQWNADGTERPELNFGGNGKTDNFGHAAGNSKTGAHHILGIAETMKRGLAPEFVITQASAHATPSSDGEYKVVNWLRSAAILADVDPVAKGYLARDVEGHWRLPAFRGLGSYDLNQAPGSLPNLLNEYATHNLSDGDFAFTGPALTEALALLAALAPRFGYDSADALRYTTKFRNPALAYLSEERIAVVFSRGGIEAVALELRRLHTLGIL